MVKKLILVTSAAGAYGRGGTQLLVEAIAESGTSLAYSVSVAQLEELNAMDVSDCVIFWQSSAEISMSERRTLEHCLELGAVIVEKNVFAMPSVNRPVHRNYRICLMSRDGQMRYQLRSRLEGLKQTSSCFVLPNPRWGSGRTSTIRSLPDRGELTLLRIGRPDPIKWSNFELEYAVALHRKTRRPVRLVRVGYPGPHAVTSVAGVRVEDLPYQDDLSEIYRGADLYVHYSRIGETFGNTVFEAQETGLPVIFAASLGWDCAPVEYLPQSSFLFASRGWLLKNADTSLSRFEFSSKSVGSSRRPVREYGEAIMQIANTAPEEMTELRSISSGVGYVWMLGTRGHGFSAAARVGAVLRMVLRSLRNRVIRS